MEQQRPALQDLEQRQAALVAERNAARRNHGPLLERSRQRQRGSSRLQHDRGAMQERLQELIAQQLTPLSSELAQLEQGGSGQ